MGGLRKSQSVSPGRLKRKPECVLGDLREARVLSLGGVRESQRIALGDFGRSQGVAMQAVRNVRRGCLQGWK